MSKIYDTIWYAIVSCRQDRFPAIGKKGEGLTSEWGLKKDSWQRWHVKGFLV